ncbi:Uncharacterised protein [Achromobacter xylosoxidans]|nr:Uncharacterised protein [Achromobacter xylosoxidans]
MPSLDRMVPIYRTGARPRREAFFSAGPPQGKNAPSGGSDPRSGERGGLFLPPGRARAGQTALLLGTGGVSIWGLQLAKASGRHFGKIVIRVDAWTARSRW